MMDQIQTPKNDKNKAGQRATEKVIFGDYSRYALYAVHTRFDAVCWFVEDADQLDYIVPDKAVVIRQEWNWVDAIDGLWTGSFHITNN
jgi:hypothetical protein